MTACPDSASANPPAGICKGLDSEVEKAVGAAIDQLAGLTAGVTTVELPPMPALSVMVVEAAKYFGPMLKTFPDGFSPAVRSMLKTGGRISATVYARDLYRLRQLHQEISNVFMDTDLLITPTTPDLPMSLDEARQPPKTHGPPPSAMNTMPFNLYGLPAISIPCGFSRSGLPIGLQIIGPPGGEMRVLALAAAWERGTDWHLRSPYQSICV